MLALTEPVVDSVQLEVGVQDAVGVCVGLGVFESVGEPLPEAVATSDELGVVVELAAAEPLEENVVEALGDSDDDVDALTELVKELVLDLLDET
jgi:hypothetical protein